jgi:hypothetical protein
MWISGDRAAIRRTRPRPCRVASCGGGTVIGAQRHGVTDGGRQLFCGGQQVHQLRAGERVEHLPPLWPGGDQGTVAQARQMVRHRRLSQPQLAGHVDHGCLTAGQVPQDSQPHRVVQATRRALKFIALTFFALAAYVTVVGIRDLAAGEEPDTSVVGSR